MTIIRCVHHLGNPDGVEDVRQDGFFRLTGVKQQTRPADQTRPGTIGPNINAFNGLPSSYTTMSPKSLHDESLAYLKELKLSVHGCGGDPDLNIVRMETSWRHQSASSLNNEYFFPAQDAQSCELGRPIFTAVGNLRRFLRDSTV